MAEETRDFWALREVSFDVAPGERVGVIGRNGSGKSTLLKILSRVTAPSEGRCVVTGRVASLLEVGTGFHPELSGRDNIALSGAILGMKRRELRATIDDIVAFAEVERFLDTPVKRYSSGMYLRLAFSVAAHLEADVLLVDEVLAVGDSNFQQKCLGRMEEIGQSGRTVIFVSHSMPAISRLCSRVLLIDAGHLIADGPRAEVIGSHMRSGGGSTAERHWGAAEAAGDEVARLRSVRVVSGDAVSDEVDIDRELFIEVVYDHLSNDPASRPVVDLSIYDDAGTLLFVTIDSTNEAWRQTPRVRGQVRTTCRIPANLLSEGTHYVLVAILTLNPTTVHAEERDAVAFHVVDHTTGHGSRGDYVGDFGGVVRPLLQWGVEQIPDGVDD